MRFFAAFLGAALITALVFLFMQGLIDSREQDEVQLVLHQAVEIVQQRQTEQQPEAEQVQDPPPQAEPALEPLQLAPRAPAPAPTLEVPLLEMTSGDIAIGAVGEQWSAPLGATAASILEGSGVGAQGFVEVVPFSTRKPNVPELAWTNKISGWVLVAFNVMPDGTTANARVLDAQPRGVFEEKVIAAVHDWMYSLRYKGQVQGQIVMTQRVEVNWKDYPMNMPNVD